MPDWPGYIEDALEMGWNLRTALARIEEATYDIFGRERADEIMKRLQLLVVQRYG